MSEKNLSEDQFKLVKQLQKLFPKAVMEVSYSHPTLVGENGQTFVLDVFFPSVGIAFEFQSEQEYMTGEPWVGDPEKLAKCAEAAISIIHVPFMWELELPTMRTFLKANGIL